MVAVGASAKRAYLSASVRRQVLLDVAARIVVERGWPALTMKGLALAAGVSRQLVYAHFEDGAQLFVAVTKHLFGRSYSATAEVLRGTSADAGSTIRAAYQILLDMPAAERRALRALAGESGAERADMRRAKAHMRDRILELWVPFAREHAKLDESQARPLVWMLTNAAWGLSDLVGDGVVSPGQAKTLLAKFVERVIGPGPGVAGGEGQTR